MTIRTFSIAVNFPPPTTIYIEVEPLFRNNQDKSIFTAMANKTYTFPDGGNLYAEYSGSGNNTVTFTADENKGDDRELTLTFRTASNSVQVQRKVIQEGGPYTFELSAITSSERNLGVQLGWQYTNGTDIAQPFNLNGEERNATVTNYWTNSTTNHTYNVVAQRGVGKNYVFRANTYNNAASITSATIESDLPAVNLASAFYDCRNLTSVEGGNLNVTNMYYTFYNCHSLNNVDGLANWDIGKVTSMALTFYNCTNLANVNGLANWNTGNVTSMAYTFYNCYNPTSLEPLANWDTVNVTNMYCTFYHLNNLTSLEPLANWNTGNVTNMAYTFYNCYNLGTHCFNSWTGASADCMDMFRYCNSLDDIQIHWNITCAANMFANRNTPLNVYASTSTNAYNAIYRAMGNSTTNSSWNVTLYELNE